MMASTRIALKTSSGTVAPLKESLSPLSRTVRETREATSERTLMTDSAPMPQLFPIAGDKRDPAKLAAIRDAASLASAVFNGAPGSTRHASMRSPNAALTVRSLVESSLSAVTQQQEKSSDLDSFFTSCLSITPSQLSRSASTSSLGRSVSGGVGRSQSTSQLAALAAAGNAPVCNISELARSVERTKTSTKMLPTMMPVDDNDCDSDVADEFSELCGKRKRDALELELTGDFDVMDNLSYLVDNADDDAMSVTSLAPQHGELDLDFGGVGHGDGSIILGALPMPVATPVVTPASLSAPFMTLTPAFAAAPAWNAGVRRGARPTRSSKCCLPTYAHVFLIIMCCSFLHPITPPNPDTLSTNNNQQQLLMRHSRCIKRRRHEHLNPPSSRIQLTYLASINRPQQQQLLMRHSRCTTVTRAGMAAATLLCGTVPTTQSSSALSSTTTMRRRRCRRSTSLRPLLPTWTMLQ
jgi:hypothetical protein